MSKLEKYKKYKEEITKLNDTYSYENGDKWIKHRLHTLLSDIKAKISIEEKLEAQLNNDNIILPNYYDDSKVYHTFIKNDVVYKIPLSPFTEGNLKFDVYAYAYIKHKDGVITLNVNLIRDNDRGDRFTVQGSYYRTRNLRDYDPYNNYYSKYYGRGHRYPSRFKDEMKVILDEFKNNADFKIE